MAGNVLILKRSAGLWTTVTDLWRRLSVDAAQRDRLQQAREEQRSPEEQARKA